MSFKVETQRTLQVSNVDDLLLNWVEAFLNGFRLQCHHMAVPKRHDHWLDETVKL